MQKAGRVLKFEIGIACDPDWLTRNAKKQDQTELEKPIGNFLEYACL